MKNKEYMKQYRQAYKAQARRLSVTLGRNTYDVLAARAKADGKRPATFARQALEAVASRSVLIPTSLEEELKAVSFLIRNIANNVNQMAHHSNLLRQLVDENALLEELRKLEDAVKSYTLNRLAKPDDDH